MFTSLIPVLTSTTQTLKDALNGDTTRLRVLMILMDMVTEHTLRVRLEGKLTALHVTLTCTQLKSLATKDGATIVGSWKEWSGFAKEPLPADANR